MAEVGFEFPVDASGQWDGFNDSAMEHFSGNPFQHLGREVPQNTIDAKAGKPARIRVSLTKIKPTAIPDLAAFRETIEQCAVAAETEQNEKSTKFFDNAKDLLAKKEVTVLQIEDSNTLGVKGPCENGKPFFALLKATGQSKKSDTSTGSYGIGKFAPFTVSGLRTVFVTTVWQGYDGSWNHYVQGKSVLTSHIDGTGATRRGTGFWGLKQGCMPIESITSDVPEWLRRTKEDGEFAGFAGTTLSILGFDAAKGWEDVLTVNILMNFFGAIKSGDLEVSIQGGHEINAATLEKLLIDPTLSKVADDQEGETGRFQTILSYLVALEGGEGVSIENTQNLHLGDCQVRILIGEKLPKKVAILRNGMLITESLPRLKRFGEFKDFVAILECTSTKGQSLLRGMEPPRHDAFEPDRLPPDRRQIGRNALREISVWVRSMLKRHAQDPVSEVTNLDEMADFFADEEEEGDGKKRDENPAGKIVIRARAIKPKLRSPSYPQSSAIAVSQTDEDEGPDQPDDESAEGENSGAGSGGTAMPEPNESSGGNDASAGGMGTLQKTGVLAPSPVRDVRAVPLADRRKRRVAFTPLSSGMGRIQLQDSGADTDRPLKIVASNVGTVNSGVVELVPLVAGQRVMLEVELEAEFRGTIKVVTDAV